MAESRYAFGDADAAEAAAAEGRKAENSAVRKAYDKMTPEEVFREFDTDGDVLTFVRTAHPT